MPQQHEAVDTGLAHVCQRLAGRFDALILVGLLGQCLGRLHRTILIGSRWWILICLSWPIILSHRESINAPVTIQGAPNGERVRSVAMNGALGGGGGPTVEGNFPNPPGPKYYGSGSSGVGRDAHKANDLNQPGPANVFVMLDEQADSINDAVFMLNPGWSRTAEAWRDLPASYHNGSGSLSFADGHSEIHKWTQINGQTVWPIQQKNYSTSTPPRGERLPISILVITSGWKARCRINEEF